MAAWSNRQWAILIAGAAIATLAGYAGFQLDRTIRIGAAYVAKITCSEVFVAERDPALVRAVEFAGFEDALAQISVVTDARRKTVAANGPLGLGRVKAVHREGYGCTLANGGRLAALPARESLATPAFPEAPAGTARAIDRVDYDAIAAATETAFADAGAGHRGVLVVVDGRVVHERYADGFSAATKFLSWSMAKSVTATLIGAAVERAFLNVADPAPVPEWAGDDRSDITWNDLLKMQSGLAFEETYENPRSDVARMLFEAPDAGALAATSPAANRPGDVWSYSSGTTNILSRALRATLEQAGVDYHDFASTFFSAAGADGFIFEPDASGTYIGSSFAYATTREWARLGQLYLDGGSRNGEQLIPAGWPSYVAQPAARSDNQYGAHFWLNREGGDDRTRYFPGLPENVYFFAGREGQYVVIIPDRNMLIVRTGLTRERETIPTVAPLFRALYDAVGATAANE